LSTAVDSLTGIDLEDPAALQELSGIFGVFVPHANHLDADHMML
jgi:hypothetical protein